MSMLNNILEAHKQIDDIPEDIKKDLRSNDSVVHDEACCDLFVRRYLECEFDKQESAPKISRGLINPIIITLETSRKPAAFATRVMNNLSSHKNESMIDVDGSIIRFLDSFFERPYPYAILTICHSGMYLDRSDRSMWDIYECQRQIDILPDEIRKILYNRNNPNYSHITHDGMTLRKFLSAGQDVPHTDSITDYFGQLSEKRFIQQKSLVIPKIVTFRDIICKAGKI